MWGCSFVMKRTFTNVSFTQKYLILSVFKVALNRKIPMFLYAMNINIFITSCVWYRMKTEKVINWQKSWTINSSNNMNLVCKAFQYDPILFQRAKLWEGLGLTGNTSLLFGLRQSDNCGFCSPRSSFLFRSWRHFNFS